MASAQEHNYDTSEQIEDETLQLQAQAEEVLEQLASQSAMQTVL
jgi:ElaB/YqjD/DUF883 family membrane-anchored ribosome-binding protein